MPRELPLQELTTDSYFTAGEIHLKALFEASEKYRIIEEYGAEAFETEKDGRLLFEWDFASYKNMREWILSFGDKVNVLEPACLRDDVHRQAENILKNAWIHDR